MSRMRVKCENELTLRVRARIDEGTLYEGQKATRSPGLFEPNFTGEKPKDILDCVRSSWTKANSDTALTFIDVSS